MTKKIIISKNALKNLYIDRRLSTHQIARQFQFEIEFKNIKVPLSEESKIKKGEILFQKI